MPSHPNRNWRARMRALREDWLRRLPDNGGCLMSANDLREHLRLAYTAGYIDGRESIQRRKTRTAV